jgi:hypothetical protein
MVSRPIQGESNKAIGSVDLIRGKRVILYPLLYYTGVFISNTVPSAKSRLFNITLHAQ